MAWRDLGRSNVDEGDYWAISPLRQVRKLLKVIRGRIKEGMEGER
jgi:hypothetical protein